jgi:spermidine synthase
VNLPQSKSSRTRWQSAESRSQWLFAALYTSSGVAGLIYQVVWTRHFSLHLGHTVAAAGTVLAAFMGGLAVGSLMAGRAAPRLDRRRALLGYAIAEIVVASFAVLLPVALSAGRPLLALAYGTEPGTMFALARLALSLALVIVPAAAMGATFPFGIRAMAGSGTPGARYAGRLYAFNTFGAAVGALATGFILIPALGLAATTAVGVALNLAAAVGAWLLSKAALNEIVADAAVPPRRATAPAPRKTAGGGRRNTAGRNRGRAQAGPVPEGVARWLAPALLGLSGFSALLYEVAFTRVLAVALGPTSYAFSAMLASIIIGLAIGAMAASWVRWTVNRAALVAGVFLLGSAIAASTAAWFAGTRLPLIIAEAVADPSAAGARVLFLEAIYATSVLLPVSCFLGALFPACTALATDRNRPLAGDVSLIYGVNTIGAVLGSLAGAFVLIPLLGVQQTVRFAAGVAVAAACLAFVAGPVGRWQRVSGLMAAVAAAFVLLLVPSWDPNLLASGAYKYASDVRAANLDLEVGLKAGRLRYYKEGPSATVSVRELAGALALAIDGKVDASNRADMLTQKLLAHLPLLLHLDPREICIIGLGSGVTLGAALSHDIDRADVVEISPEVVEASSFFASDNGRALDDRRAHLIVTDGRSHLRLSSRRYDVIISEPSNPWMAGVASLFTREFFEAARDRLTEGGIICQWAHTYDIADEDLRSIAATFASVFPNGTMWLVGDGDLLFIGTNGPAPPAIENITRRWPETSVTADLVKAAVYDPFSLLSLYVGGPAELRRYGQGAPIQTDDRPLLEFSGPLGVFDRRENVNRRTVQALLDPTTTPVPVRAAVSAAGSVEWRNRGRMALGAHDYAAAFDDFSASLQSDPDDEIALAGLFETAGAAMRAEDAERLLESLANRFPRRPAVLRTLARLLAATGDLEQATNRAQEAMAAAPEDPRGAEALASILADAGDLERLRPLAVRLQATWPDRDETWYYAAIVSFLEGNLAQTVERAERAAAINARHAAAHNLIGSASAALGQRDRARQAFQASLSANPVESSTYANLGRLEMEAGNHDAALAYFAESLTLDPADESTRRDLSTILGIR